MSAAAVEHPCDGEPESLLEWADRLSKQNPGCRVEIIGGILTVTPPADGDHADVLTDLMVSFIAAGLHGKATRVHQGSGVWLPSGPLDYAVPDLMVVDADFRDHVMEAGCFDPTIVHLVAEVTSSNYNNDLRNKVNAYAEAGIPVYLIVNRRHNRVHVLTDPAGDEYGSHQVYAPGQRITLPGSIGPEGTLEITLEASELLRDRGTAE
jgi:Uma2 family endonuclease